LIFNPENIHKVEDITEQIADYMNFTDEEKGRAGNT